MTSEPRKSIWVVEFKSEDGTGKWSGYIAYYAQPIAYHTLSTAKETLQQLTRVWRGEPEVRLREYRRVVPKRKRGK